MARRPREAALGASAEAPSLQSRAAADEPSEFGRVRRVRAVGRRSAGLTGQAVVLGARSAAIVESGRPDPATRRPNRSLPAGYSDRDPTRSRWPGRRPVAAPTGACQRGWCTWRARAVGGWAGRGAASRCAQGASLRAPHREVVTAPRPQPRLVLKLVLGPADADRRRPHAVSGWLSGGRMDDTTLSCGRTGARSPRGVDQWRGGRRPTPAEALGAIVHYALHDALQPTDGE